MRRLIPYNWFEKFKKNIVVNESTNTTEIGGNLEVDGNALTDKYAETENAVGKWIDGSTIYRKTYVKNTITSFTANVKQNVIAQLPADTTNAKVINIKGVCICQNSMFQIGGLTATNTNINTSLNIGASRNIYMTCNTAQELIFDKIIIVVDYIK